LAILALAIVSALTFGLVLSKLDPGSGSFNLFCFYLNVFVLIGSVTFLVGYFFRQKFGMRELAWDHIKISVRQGIWFGLFISISFLLLANGLFTWWNGLLLIIALVFLESYFLFK
jgi:hypothetical protein